MPTLKIALPLALTLAVPSAAMAFDLGPTEAVNYSKATRYMMCGPNTRVNLRAGGVHTFNLKNVQYIYSDDGSTQWIMGQISHHLSFRPDDQIFFTHTYKAADGFWKFEKTESRINRGGWSVFLGPLGAAVQAYLISEGEKLKDVKPDDINKNTMNAAALVGGNWEGAVNVLMANVALAGQNWQFCSM